MVRTALYFAAFVSAAGWVVWKGVLAKQWVEDVEYEGNVDAEKALEDLDESEAKKKEEAEKGKAGAKGKGKK